MTRLYRVTDGIVIGAGDRLVQVSGVDWDDLFNRGDLASELRRLLATGVEIPPESLAPRAPIQQQEVWAAGVTYQRSKAAREEDSAAAGGSDFYDQIYHAHRPELFFKATPHRVAGPGEALTLRSDSLWTVPEPEFTLALNREGHLFGLTIGNDLSSRDIEGANPLYLPQAKVWGRCAGLGPCVLVLEGEPDPGTEIRMVIERAGEAIFAGHTQLDQMKQTLGNLREHLFRDNAFPQGCYLMTGTGIVPPDDVMLQAGDEVAITVDGIGTLRNPIVTST